jgi:hypothetical protein
MGMFDRFELVGKNDAVLCAAGHEMRSLQTKDTDCDADTYLVFDGLLYKVEQLDVEYEYTLHYKGLASIQKRYAQPVSLGANASVVAYSACEECLPVLTEAETDSFWGGRLIEHQPWVEYEFLFDGGHLTAVKPLRLETRDELRQKFSGSLPDDDRVAKRHYEKRNQKNARR